MKIIGVISQTILLCHLYTSDILDLMRGLIFHLYLSDSGLWGLLITRGSTIYDDESDLKLYTYQRRTHTPLRHTGSPPSRPFPSCTLTISWSLSQRLVYFRLLRLFAIQVSGDCNLRSVHFWQVHLEVPSVRKESQRQS